MANRLPNITLTGNAGSTARSRSTSCSRPVPASGAIRLRDAADLSRRHPAEQEVAARAAFEQAPRNIAARSSRHSRTSPIRLTALATTRSRCKKPSVAENAARPQPRHHAPAPRARRHQLSRLLNAQQTYQQALITSVSGAGQSLCRYRGAVSGARRRLVEPRRRRAAEAISVRQLV